MRVRTSSFLQPGQIVVVADYEHPEITTFDVIGWTHAGGLTVSPAPVPDGRIICCHPDDEQRVRDALALAQEMAA